MGSGPLRRFRLAYDLSELFRRYFINTLFDSTFVVLGIVAATAVVSDTPTIVILATLAGACLAIGISTGVSVYEAERLEAEIRLAKIERAMLAQMKDTQLHRSLRLYRLMVSFVNFLAPLFVFGVTASPFLSHVAFGWPGARSAAEASIVLAVALVFGAGFALGKLLEGGALRQGLRMTVAALATFLLLVMIQSALS